jgi:Phage-related holin (Lysis protein)
MPKLKAFSIGGVKLDFFNRFWRFFINGFVGFTAALIPTLFGVGYESVVQSLIVLILLDTCLGFWKGWVGVGEELTSSRKLRAFFTKVICYGAAIIMAVQVERAFLSLGINFRYGKLGLYEIALCVTGGTEVISIIENLGQLGFKIPKMIAKHLEVLKDFDTRDRD